MPTSEQVWRYCRVCGYEPADPPWGVTGLVPTYEFCPSCGVEYGNEDYTESSTTAYRDSWLSTGGAWVDERHRDDGLTTSERLQRILGESVRGGVVLDSVVDDFVATEVDESLRQLLIDAVEQSTPGEKRFEFNVFDVRIRRDAGVVVVEDVLDATRSEELDLGEFLRRLGSRP